MSEAALKMTCGGCGKVNEIDLPTVQTVARTEAEKITDAQLAKRYRVAFARMVRAALPQSLWRLPLGAIDRLSDEVSITIGRDVLTLMLSPVE